MPAFRTRVRSGGLRRRATALVTATAALLGASVALAPAALAASTVGTVTITAPTTADEGDTITVSLPVDATSDLFAYELVVTYDDDLLEFDDASGDFPDGGYDSVTESADTVTFAHTRLGTSPGLTGAQTLVTFTFTVLDGGDASIRLASATFVDSSGGSTALAAPVTADVALAAAPVASPSPTPTASASPSTTSSPSATPTAAAAAADETDADPLAATGYDASGLLVASAFAVAVVALGAVLVIRRRKEGAL